MGALFSKKQDLRLLPLGFCDSFDAMGIERVIGKQAERGCKGNGALIWFVPTSQISLKDALVPSDTYLPRVVSFLNIEIR